MMKYVARTIRCPLLQRLFSFLTLPVKTIAPNISARSLK
jgi:hypothetical protein